MPAALRPEWVERLRRSVPGADLRFNYLIHRWEFILPSADGVPRSQFWGHFYTKNADGTRNYLKPNEVTGLHDFRDLDDEAIEEACANLEKTFIGNPWDGAMTTRREVRRRMRFNDELRKSRYKAAGELWADMFVDRLPRMRGTQQVTVLADVKKRLPRGALVDRHGAQITKERKPVGLLDASGKPLPSTSTGPSLRVRRRFA